MSGWAETQFAEFDDKFVGDDGVEHQAVVNEQETCCWELGSDLRISFVKSPVIMGKVLGYVVWGLLTMSCNFSTASQIPS